MWGEIRWGEVNWVKVMWGAVIWGEVMWGEVRCREVRWGYVRWNELSWGEVRWGEMRWGEVRWNWHTLQAFLCHDLKNIKLRLLICEAHPVQYKLKFTRRRVIFCMCFPIVYAFIYQILGMVPSTKIVDGQCLPYRAMSKAVFQFYGCLSFTMEYVVPMAVMFYCYARIFHIIRHNHKVVPRQGKCIVYIPNMSTSYSHSRCIETNVIWSVPGWKWNIMRLDMSGNNILCQFSGAFCRNSQ